MVDEEIAISIHLKSFDYKRKASPLGEAPRSGGEGLYYKVFSPHPSLRATFSPGGRLSFMI